MEDYIYIIDLKELAKFKEAQQHLGCTKAMEKELQSIQRNHTWDLVDRPLGKTPITSKWVFKTTLTADGRVEKLKADWLHGASNNYMKSNTRTLLFLLLNGQLLDLWLQLQHEKVGTANIWTWNQLSSMETSKRRRTWSCHKDRLNFGLGQGMFAWKGHLWQVHCHRFIGKGISWSQTNWMRKQCKNFPERLTSWKVSALIWAEYVYIMLSWSIPR